MEHKERAVCRVFCDLREFIFVRGATKARALLGLFAFWLTHFLLPFKFNEKTITLFGLLHMSTHFYCAFFRTFPFADFFLFFRANEKISVAFCIYTIGAGCLIKTTPRALFLRCLVYYLTYSQVKTTIAKQKQFGE